MSKEKRKVMIVFEDTGLRTGPLDKGGQQPFVVYYAGDTERIGSTNLADLNASEFYAVHAMSVIAEMMRKCGALQTITKRPDPNEKIQ